MEKENKYYTPTTEEIYNSPEIVFDENPEMLINPFIYRGVDIFIDLTKETSFYNCKVKYLDKEDIESLGFKLTSCIDEFPEYEKGETIINLFQKNTNIYSIKNPGGTLFQGTIKNKSELKTLLKQLNINK